MHQKPEADFKSAQVSPIKRILFSLLRKFFKLLYHQFAFAYDWVAAVVSTGKWRFWTLSVLPYCTGPRILEIGHGPGHLFVALQARGLVMIGIDESPQMGQIARKRIARTRSHPNLIRGSANNLPFSNHSFDQVVMTFPAEFLLKPQTFSEIHRLLVDGGSVIILPLAWITGRKPWERLAAWVNRITGEAPHWDERVLEPLKNQGFDVHWEILELVSSQVLLIRLQKSTSDP